MTNSTCAPGLARLARRSRIPCILAHQDAGFHAIEFDDGRLGARREIALLVEHAIVGQAGLAMIGEHRAVANHDGRIENRRADIFGIAGDQGDAAHFLFEPLERARHLQAHAGVKQQVLRRIAGHREFRQHDHIRAIAIARLIGGGDDARGIAVDIADDQVELRHDTAHLARVFQFTCLIWDAGRCA